MCHLRVLSSSGVPMRFPKKPSLEYGLVDKHSEIPTKFWDRSRAVLQRFPWEINSYQMLWLRGIAWTCLKWLQMPSKDRHYNAAARRHSQYLHANSIRLAEIYSRDNSNSQDCSCCKIVGHCAASYHRQYIPTYK